VYTAGGKYRNENLFLYFPTSLCTGLTFSSVDVLAGIFKYCRFYYHFSGAKSPKQGWNKLWGREGGCPPPKF